MQRRVPRSLTLICPNRSCESHGASPDSVPIVRFGRFFRAEEAKWIPRFRCNCCDKTFSTASTSPCFRQKKRKLNPLVFKLLASSVSQRRIAIVLGINLKTVERKFLFLAKQAQMSRLTYLRSIQMSEGKIERILFDEMETFERSKCLPLSIPLVVEAKTRKILGFRVAKMPAKGLLAPISLKKYGPRRDLRPQAAHDLFTELRSAIADSPTILTDKNPKYPGWLTPHFGNATHITTKGRRGCVVGQGELKSGGFDPLFGLNHTCAMIRANVNRLVRRTWATTKKPERLMAHLEIYAQYHNRVLT
jgi:hypothetical protein